MDPAPNEALGALERLYRRNVITLEEGQAAARLLTGDESVTFPPPSPAPRATPPGAPATAPEAPAAPQEPAAPPPGDATDQGTGSN